MTNDMLPGVWIAIKDGDDRARALYHRHYSRRVYKDGRQPKLFCGPGQKLVLLSLDCDALFVWRKFKDDSGQVGVNCAVFRNEGPQLASSLILQAEPYAWQRWPGERLYTFVNAKKLQPTRQPGRCFLKAGWTRLALTTKGGLLIFEKLPMEAV